MWIKSQEGRLIVDADMVKSISSTSREIFAYSLDGIPYVLGYYETEAEAVAAMNDIGKQIAGGLELITLPGQVKAEVTCE